MKIREIQLIRQNIFESHIDVVDNEKLISELNNFYKNNNNSFSGDIKFPLAGPESEKLQNEINSRVDIVAGKKMKCREFWMFTMKNGGAVPRHNHKTNYQLHPEEYYSIAYYPLTTDGGANLHFVANYCNTMEEVVSIKAECGKLIIFNSFIDHYTDRHSIDSERICISANYKPVDPDKSLVSDWTRFAKPGTVEDSRISKFS